MVHAHPACALDNRLNDHRRDFMTMRRHQAGKAHHIALIPFAIHAALRGGSVVGEHSVIFATEGERIELSHKAEDRGLFANGALRAAFWVRDREPGYYTMTDLLRGKLPCV